MRVGDTRMCVRNVVEEVLEECGLWEVLVWECGMLGRVGVGVWFVGKAEKGV